MPRVGSDGTVEVFDVTMRPSTWPTRSVNVPPMSTPTMFMRAPSGPPEGGPFPPVRRASSARRLFIGDQRDAWPATEAKGTSAI
jgi:hypothetical protein